MSLLWLLLLRPLATPGLRGSLAMATPALAAGETLEGSVPAPSARPLAPGAPGTMAACVVWGESTTLQGWGLDCGWRPATPGYLSFISSPPSLPVGIPETTQHRRVSGTPLNSWASCWDLPQDLWVGP